LSEHVVCCKLCEWAKISLSTDCTHSLATFLVNWAALLGLCCSFSSLLLLDCIGTALEFSAYL
jgi:hypothetical protein